MKNIPDVKLGIAAVSRDCFPMSLSASRCEAVVKACKEIGVDVFKCPTTIESETHMMQALEELKGAGCNALVVYLGNFGPESAETLLAKYFDGPVMFVAAAEETQDNLVGGRGLLRRAECKLQLSTQKHQGIHTRVPCRNSYRGCRYDKGIYPCCKSCYRS